MRRWVAVSAAFALIISTASCGETSSLSSGSVGESRSRSDATPSRVAATTPPASPQAATTTILATADDGDAVWSPDGRWFLLWSSSEQGHVALYRQSGERIRSLAGDYAVWLDSTSFAVARGDTLAIGSVDADTVAIAPVGLGKVPRANGRGAIAITISTSPDSYVIWARTGQKGRFSGFPLAWSEDGGKLAVQHFTCDDCGPARSGWIEIRSWPNTSETRSFRALEVGAATAAFDPSGRYLLLPNDGQILDTTTGSAVRITAGSAVWNETGDVLVPTAAGAVTEFTSAGRQVGSFDTTADTVTASSDGNTILAYGVGGFVLPSPKLFVIASGKVKNVSLPGDPWPTVVHPSPNGRSAIVGWSADGKNEIVLIAL